MSKKKLIETWVELFNKIDLEGLANLYHEDAINHQVNATPIVGREAIRQMFKEEFAKATMICEIESIFEDGDWAILEWKDPLGLRGCGFFQIKDSKIVFQRGYWDLLSFLRIHRLPLPTK
jgi:limonene-1,2-epoxide hydrolase